MLERKCPECGHNNHKETSRFKYTKNTKMQEYHCNICGARWLELWKRTKIRVTRKSILFYCGE